MKTKMTDKYRPFLEADFHDFCPFGDRAVLDFRNDSSLCFVLIMCQYPVSICTYRAESFTLLSVPITYIIKGNKLEYFRI